MSWFRLHTNCIHHAVVWALPPQTFKAWVGLLCLAKDGDGIIPNVKEVAFKLRCGQLAAQRWIDELVNDYNLLEPVGDGTFKPHNWSRHQYVSDVSTSRVKRFRERSRNESETAPDTEYRNRVQSTETEQIQMPRTVPAREIISALRETLFDDWFEEVYSRHPKKKDRGIAMNYLVEANPPREEFNRVHGLWCAEWAKDKPQFAPPLAQWILDKGWLYPPDIHKTNGLDHSPVVRFRCRKCRQNPCMCSGVPVEVEFDLRVAW